LFGGSFGRRHLAWINRGSGGILLATGAVLLATFVAGHMH